MKILLRTADKIEMLVDVNGISMIYNRPIIRPSHQQLQNRNPWRNHNENRSD